MAAELFKMMSGLESRCTCLIEAGGQMLTDLARRPGAVRLGGTRNQLNISGRVSCVLWPWRRRGAWEGLPDIPAVGEFVPGYEASGWCGLVAPKNTPVAIIHKLNHEINAGVADPKIKARFGDLVVAVFPGSPVDFGQHFAAETEKWAKVIRAANIKPE